MLIAVIYLSINGKCNGISLLMVIAWDHFYINGNFYLKINGNHNDLVLILMVVVKLYHNFDGKDY